MCRTGECLWGMRARLKSKVGGGEFLLLCLGFLVLFLFVFVRRRWYI